MKRLLLILLLFFTTTNVIILRCEGVLNNITYYDNNGNQYNYNPIEEERKIFIEDSIYNLKQDSLLAESIKTLNQ